MNQRFKQFIKEGERPLFIPFITAGDPTPEGTVEIALLLQEAGANAIELGIPYSDPLADGPVIQRASKRALAHGMSLKKAMALVPEMRKRGLEIPVVIFTYYNLLLQLGEDQFYSLAQENEIDGLLVPDLPFEESDHLLEAGKNHDLPLISLVAPTTSKKRLQQIASQAQGFLYCVSSLGVTGVREGEFKPVVYDFLSSVRQFSQVPIAVGFGISNAEQIKSLGNYCDGVIVGSAIVGEIEKRQKELIDPIHKSKALDELRSFLFDLLGRSINTRV
ncbi:MAG TPA: tryptophan synthase subunit alpha [Bacillales bacterium]|nr:tryptophan synthase subunit alpha [Bacillales bacterium]